MEYYGYNDYRNYLKHHGILGQKWGKRNGPPYPLGSGKHSASERKAGWRKSLDGGSGTSIRKTRKKTSTASKAKDFQLTDEQKKALKIGAIAVGSALAVAGGIYLAKSGKLSLNGKNIVNNYLPGVGGGTKNIDDVTGFKKLSKPVDAIKAARSANPNKYSMDAYMNCGNSSIAWEARLRGLDVQARSNNEGMTLEGMASCFKGIHSNTFKDCDMSSIKPLNINDGNVSLQEVRSRGKQVFEAFRRNIDKEMPVNSRGALTIPTYRGGHFMTWAKDGDGNVTIYNPQNQSLNKTALYEFAGLYHAPRNSNIGNAWFMRTDDLEFNKDTIKNVIRDHVGIDDDEVSTYTVGKVASNSFVTMNPSLKKAMTTSLTDKESIKYQKEQLKTFYRR